MSRRLTRRQLAAVITAPLALAGAPSAPQAAADDLEAAQKSVRQDSKKLAQYPLPPSIEPAFHFKA